MSTGQLIIGYGCGVILIFIFAWIVLTLSWAHRKLDSILDHFQKSIGVVTLTPLKNGGKLGKLMLIGGISSYVTFSEFYLKRGQLNLQDLESVPASLKRKLIALQWSLLGLLTTLLLLVLAGKSGLFY